MLRDMKKLENFLLRILRDQKSNLQRFLKGLFLIFISRNRLNFPFTRKIFVGMQMQWEKAH